MKLDNAAKIYPAARTRRWTNVFRVSITLKEEINPEVLQTALDKIRRRFPSICVKVKPGMFWYYIEETGFSPTVEEEGPHACMKMSFSDIKNCAFRVLYYKNRISAEFFHSLTDGNGALVFLKTLAATYIEIKHNIDIPHTDGVLDISTGAKKEELEDSFLKYSRKVKSGRRDTNAYILRGTHINENFTPLITGVIDVDEIKQKAKEHNITITSYLVSILCYVLQNIQEDKIVDIRKRKPIKILLPVNLRTFYPSKTLRNFVLYITPGINPQMGRYSFEEITKSIYHQMGYELTEKQMNARIVTNVNDELNPIVRIMPLFIKKL